MTEPQPTPSPPTRNGPYYLALIGALLFIAALYGTVVTVVELGDSNFDGEVSSAVRWGAAFPGLTAMGVGLLVLAVSWVLMRLDERR